MACCVSPSMQISTCGFFSDEYTLKGAIGLSFPWETLRAVHCHDEHTLKTLTSTVPPGYLCQAKMPGLTIAKQSHKYSPDADTSQTLCLGNLASSFHLCQLNTNVSLRACWLALSLKCIWWTSLNEVISSLNYHLSTVKRTHPHTSVFCSLLSSTVKRKSDMDRQSWQSH